jgi:hypothetical protein
MARITRHIGNGVPPKERATELNMWYQDRTDGYMNYRSIVDEENGGFKWLQLIRPAEPDIQERGQFVAVDW